MSLSGDPTFFNTAGDVTLSGTITSPGFPVAVVASGNVLTSGALTIDTTDSTPGPGSAVTIIAGADMVPSTVPAAGQQGPDSGTTLTINGPSATGGKIDLTGGGGLATINTQGLSGDGGTVQMIAFAGGNAQSGTITLPKASTITTASQTGTNNGDVIIMAGAPSGTAISTGSIDASNGNTGFPGTGEVVIRTSMPVINGPFTILNGAITAGNFSAGPTQAASVVTGAITTNQSPVLIMAGKDVTIGNGVSGNIITNGNGIGIFAGGNITSNATGGGIIDAGGGNGAGSITIGAGVNLQPNGANDGVTIAGRSVTGGTIDLTQGGVAGITALQSVANNGSGASGGFVSIFAEAGNTANSGRVILPGGVTILTTGDTVSQIGNGDVAIMGGASTGTAVAIGFINTSGGGDNTGNVTVASAQLSSTNFPTDYTAGVLTLPAGFLVAGPATAGSVTVADITAQGSTITVTSAGTVSLGAIANNPTGATGSTQAGSVFLTTSGTMVLNGSINVSDTVATATGGTAILSAAAFSMPGVSGANINVDGDALGGIISITGTSKLSPVTIGSGTGTFQLSSLCNALTGTMAGSVSITSAGDVMISNPVAGINVNAPSGSNANGGTIFITAGTSGQGNVTISGTLHADGDTSSITATGGTINITTTSTTPFDIGNAVPNGASGLSAVGALGGTISVVNTGAGGINLSVPASVTAVINPGGSGGSISLSTPSTISTSGAAGTLSIDGGGGTINLTAKSYNLTNALTLSASSFPGNGLSGGTINITGTGFGKGVANLGTITVGSATGDFIINAFGDSTSGNGGALNITSAANIVVNPASLNINAQTGSGGNGGSVTLKAGTGTGQTGTVRILGSLDVSGDPIGGGAGGSIAITTNSTTPFLLTVLNPLLLNGVNGALTATGTSVSGSNNISITNLKGAINVNNAIDVTTTNGPGGSISLTAGAGNITVTSLGGTAGGNLTADGVGAGGGVVSVSAVKGIVSLPGVLSANGDVGQPGGLVTVVTNSATAFQVGGAAAGKPGTGGIITAIGDAGGGFVSITNSGAGGIKVGTILIPNAISVAASAGPGGFITLAAPKGPVFITGTLSADGGGGFGGSVSITSNSAKAFSIDPLAKVNGITGTISAQGTAGDGGSITISNLGAGGIFENNTATNISVAGTANGGNITLNGQNGIVLIRNSLDVSGAAGSNGGTITINSNSAKPFSICPCSTVVPSGVVSLTANGDIGGTINVFNQGSGGIILGGGSSVSVAATGNGGTIRLSAVKGVMTLSTSSSATLAADGGGGNGGNIHLLAQSYKVTGTGLGAFTLSANGTAGFNGGNVSIFSSGAGKLLVIGNNPGQFHVNAQGDSGGTVTLSSGGNLTIDPNALTVSPSSATGNGATLIFTAGAAGNGLLNITSGITANWGGSLLSGQGGTIALFVNSSTAFNIGSPSLLNPNGVNGGLVADGQTGGGSVGVKNLGAGGVTVSNPSSINVSSNTVGTASGIIDLEAPKGNLSIAAGTLSVDGVLGGSNAGRIVLNAKTIVPSATGNVALSANGTGVNGNGGNINVTQTNTSTAKPITLGNLNEQLSYFATQTGTGTEGTASFTSASNIVVAGSVGHSNDNLVLTVSPTGLGTINTTSNPTAGMINADFLTLNIGKGDVGSSVIKINPGSNPSGDIGTTDNLQTTINNLTVTSQGGSIWLRNTQPITLLGETQKQIASKPGHFFAIGAVGNITVNGKLLSPNGNVFLVSVLTGGGSVLINNDIVGGAINLNADRNSAGGAITQSAGIIGQAGGGLAANAGGGGIFLGNVDCDDIGIAGTNGNATVVNNGTIKQLTVGNGFLNVNVSATGSISTGSLLPVGATTSLTLTTLQGSNGSVILNNTFGSATSNVTINCDGFGSIYEVGATTTISGNNVTLSSGSGNIGTNATALAVTVAPGGGISAFTGGAGSVNINATGASMTVGASQSGGNFKFVSSGVLATGGNISATHGSLTLDCAATAGNNITIGPSTTLFSGAGSLTVENDNTTNGQILIDTGAALVGNGQVNVVLGSVPTAPMPGSLPANINLSATSTVGGNVFFGTNLIAGVLPTNLVNATDPNTKIVFNTGSFAPGNLKLNGGVTITANAAPTIVTSLDLTNKAAVAAIVAGGPGITNGLTIVNGLPTGGTLTLSNNVVLANLTALNIPAHVTVSLVGFDATNPIGVQVSGPLTTKNPIITGTMTFTQGATPVVSNGNLFVSSTVPGVIFTVAKTGNLTSDENLSVIVGGDSSYIGTVTAPGNLSIAGTAGNNFKNNALTPGTLSGAISISGSMLGGPSTGFGTLSVATTAGIFQKAGSSMAGQTVDLTVGGTNIIKQLGFIVASNLVLELGDEGGVFGSAKNGVLTTNLSIITLPVSTAAVTLSGYSAVTLQSVSVGGLLTLNAPSTVAGASNITVNNFSTISCGSCTLTTQTLNVVGTISTSDPNGTVLIQAPSATTGVLITGDGTSGDGIITANAGVTVKATAAKGNVLIEGNDQLSTSSGIVKVTSNAGVTIAAQLAAGNGVVISAKTVTLGANIPFSSSTTPVGAFLSTTSGDINVKATAGNISFAAASSTAQSNGGNVIMLASGNIIDGVGANNFTASALGVMATNAIGGGIELGAGTTVSSLLPAFNLSPGTFPVPVLQPLGLAANIVNTTNVGAVQANLSGGGFVNLTIPPSTPPFIPGTASFALNGGVVVFDAKAGKSVQLSGGVFTTTAFVPIGYTTSTNAVNAVDDEVVVDTDNDLGQQDAFEPVSYNKP
jgi:hypothetical protein